MHIPQYLNISLLSTLNASLAARNLLTIQEALHAQKQITHEEQIKAKNWQDHDSPRVV